MYEISDFALAAIASGASLAAKVELLNPDLTPLREIAASDVRVSVRDNVIRRTITLRAVNDGSLTPDPAGFYFGTPIRSWLGIRYASSVEWIPTFTGYPDDPEDISIGPGGEISIPGRDRFRIIAESTFGEPLTLGAEWRVSDVIRKLFEDAGFGSADWLYNFTDGNRTLGAPYTWEVDRNRLEAAVQLAEDFALEIFCSPMGIATLRPFVDPNTVAPVITYGRSVGVRMLGFRKKWIDRLRNRMIVVGGAGNAAPIRVELRDMNPLSPGYNPPLGHPDFPGPLGDRPDRYASAGIVNEDVAYDVARRRLSARALVEEQIAIEIAVNPALELHDVIGAFDLRTATDGSWLLDGFEISHGPSTSVLPARRVRPLE